MFVLCVSVNLNSKFVDSTTNIYLLKIFSIVEFNPGDLFEVREIVLLFYSSSIFMLSSVFTNSFCIIYSYQMLLFLVSADAQVEQNPGRAKPG